MTQLFKIGQEVQVNSTTAIEYLLERGYTTKGTVHRFTSYRNIRDELVTSYIVKFTNGNKYTKYAVKEAHLQEPLDDNDFNSQAEVWGYLLSGGKIKHKDMKHHYFMQDNQLVCTTDTTEINKSPASTFSNYYSFTKYIEPAKWYENIPKDGILCWVSDYSSEDRKDTSIILKKDSIGNHPYKAVKNMWTYATPVTQEEVNKLIYKP